MVFADAGYQGAAKRPEATGVQWHVAMRPGKRRALDKTSPCGHLLDKAEKMKASVRAKVEYPFGVIKCQFGFTKVRYKGLAKNTAQLITLFALPIFGWPEVGFAEGPGVSAPTDSQRTSIQGKSRLTQQKKDKVIGNVPLGKTYSLMTVSQAKFGT